MLYQMKRISVLVSIIVWCVIESVYSQTSGTGLKLSADGRYLTTSDGTPYLVMADAAWNLITGLSTDSAKWYLSQRAEEGFNTYIIWLPSPASLDPPQHQHTTNRYGQEPFTGTPFQSSLNEAYWTHADTVIDYGISLGLNFIILPAYLGYLCNSSTPPDGAWCGDISSATNSQMFSYGTTIGNRYKARTNIIWGMGGDCSDVDYPTAWDRQSSMLNGIIGSGDTHLVTNHNHRNTVGIEGWNNDPRITLNNIYIGSPGGLDTSVFRLGNVARAISPARPFLLIEGMYEGDGYGATQQTLRAQTYHTMLLGGCGYTFGAANLYMFGADGMYFQNYLNTTGSNGQTSAKELFNSRHWHNFIPDQDHTVLTLGYGTFGTSNYAIAASTSDSSSIIAYLPTQRSVTINPSSLKGDSIQVWWFNPSNGVYINAGMYSKVTQSYTPPSNGDWVIVIDGKGVVPTRISVSDIRNLPHEYSLSQNYPNPFNPTAAIVYGLPRRVHVVLELYNSLGQLVKRIVDTMQNAGYHQVNVNSQELSTGVYFYRFQAEEFVQTRKLLVLK
jgi:hypothetical protein